MPKLYAISDLHLANKSNRDALEELCSFPEDWLILAGDIGESEEHLRFALSVLSNRFARLLWVPGNHDLWTMPSKQEGSGFRGEAKYRRLVTICREFGVLTPEDPYVQWRENNLIYRLVPMFLLYDYTFRPDEVATEDALAWAEEAGTVCSDEFLLHPDPFPSREAWCEARCRYTEERLKSIQADRLILISHFPLHEELVQLRRIPRFSLWCGTRRTADWHKRFPVEVAVYGHLHIRGTRIVDGVRFEEVSLGYPRQWQQENGIEPYLREILPGPR